MLGDILLYGMNSLRKKQKQKNKKKQKQKRKKKRTMKVF